jgi:cyclophilin family peptidyl-prolyl cis-trans isomerase
MQCYLDVSIGGSPAGRIVVKLYEREAPKSSLNFRYLCTGEKGVGPKTGLPLSYKQSRIHRVVKNFMVRHSCFCRFRFCCRDWREKAL